MTPSQWTRFKEVGVLRNVTVQLYDLDRDVVADVATTQARSHIAADTGRLLFDPLGYNYAAANYQLPRHLLDERTLHGFAEMATRIRKRFECDEHALLALRDDPTDSAALKEIARSVKIKRRTAKLHKPKMLTRQWNGFETKESSDVCRARRRSDLTAAELLQVVCYWKAHKATVADLATKFNIRKTVMQRIVKSYRKDPDMLARAKCLEEVKLEQVTAVVETVRDLLAESKPIWSTEQIRRLAESRTSYQLKSHLVAAVLRDQL